MADSIPITPQLAEFWNAVLGDGSFTYEDVKARGGPSQPTLTKLTLGRGTISEASARRLEDAIGLERGSIRSVARGGHARWKPEGAPGEEHSRLGWRDSVTKQWRTVEDLFEGYGMASAFADYCWRAGLPRQEYHELSDAVFNAYRIVLELQQEPQGESEDRHESGLEVVEVQEAAMNSPEPAGLPEPEQP